jgi:hypothetical protein
MNTKERAGPQHRRFGLSGAAEFMGRPDKPGDDG